VYEHLQTALSTCWKL